MMRNAVYSFLIIGLFISVNAFAKSASLAIKTSAQAVDTDQLVRGPVVAKGSKPKLISRQFNFTEGPSADRKGNIFFTDQPNNQIWEYNTNGHLSLFLFPAGRSNGTFFDKSGNLITCADEKDELWSISPDKQVSILVSNYQNHRLNGPNDLWIAPNGDIYFTDPYYQRDYWKRTKSDMPGMYVFYLPKGKHEATPLIKDLNRPNGIIGTPDGKTLYVADIGASKIYRYHINADGTLSDKKLFADRGSDGMTIDNKGDIYLCGDGVSVYNPMGEKIAHIPIPEKWSANVCFGGRNRKLLFITASEGVYTVKMRVKGVKSY